MSAPSSFTHTHQEAAEAEEELLWKLAPTEQWEDPEFPPSGESLYLDPYHPPRGVLWLLRPSRCAWGLDLDGPRAALATPHHPAAALPPLAFDWLRISSKEIIGMDKPTLFNIGSVGWGAGRLPH
jgi:hypothetical protein